MTPAHQELQRLADCLARLRRGEAGVGQLADAGQATTSLRAALPERFGTVLGELLNRLEASQLFTEESCSFSQTDLLDSLQLWVDKAGQQLARG